VNFPGTISFAMILANTTHLYQQTHNSKTSFLNVTCEKIALGFFQNKKKPLSLFKVFFKKTLLNPYLALNPNHDYSLVVKKINIINGLKKKPNQTLCDDQIK
jgi:hypothetical protein